jgi:beta-lactamase class A
MRAAEKPRVTVFALLTIPLALLGCASAAGPAGRGAVAERLEPFFQRAGVTVAVAYRDLGSGVSFHRNEDEVFHAASIMKVPVMMALFEAVDAGELRLTEPLPVRNEFRSIVDGSPFALDPAEDGDPDLYAALGGSRPLEELIRRMIVRSSNLATNLLIERIGAPRATALMRRLGAGGLEVLRGVEDQKAFDAGRNNTVTARGLEVALTALAEGTTFSPASNEAMLDILAAQEFNDKIPALLPPGTRVAHKTGDITAIHHDAAIVFPPGQEPYVLVVLTRGYADEKAADRAIAEISRVVWDARGGG